MERVKRWMCTLLAVCVILTLLPVTAAAEDPNGEQEATQPVARLTLDGTVTPYTSLLDAVADAQKAENTGCTVTLLESVELGSETLTVTEGRFTLDLNGKSIQAEDKIKQNAMGRNHAFSNTVLEIAGESAVSLTVLNSDKNSIAVLGLTGANGCTVMYVNNANAALTIGSEGGGQIRLDTAGGLGASGMNLSAGRATCYTGIFPHIALNNDQDLNDLLPVGRAFHYCEADGTLVTSGWRYGIIDGYGKKTAGGGFTYFTVVAHEHAFSDDNKCACGLVMDEPCPHPENRIDWVNGKCRQCQAELQAQLTAAETNVFYPSLLDAAAAAQKRAGCTVKVLRDMNLGANTLTVREGRFTLDLNGRTVTADEQQVGAIPDPLRDFGTVLSVEGGEVQLVNTVENTTATLALNCVNGSTVNVSGGKLTVGSRKDTGGQIRFNGGTMMSGQGLNWSGGMVKCYSGIFQNFRRTEGRPLCDALPAGKLFHYCDKDGVLQYQDDLGTIVGGPVDSTTSTIRQNYIIVMTDSNYTPVSMGDVNGNGTIDVLDIACLYTYLTTGAAKDYHPEAADVNGDDTVDVYDLQMLYEFIRGIRTALPG